MERLQQILLFRELEFSLRDIKAILDNPGFDNDAILEQQINMLVLKKQRLDGLIELARFIKKKGVYNMDFSAFDTSKIRQYADKAKSQFGHTTMYKEYETKNISPEAEKIIGIQIMDIFKEFGEMRDLKADSKEVQYQVNKLQSFISENLYNCTDDVLFCLADMYANGGEFTKNIDNTAGQGTAEFVCKAIKEKVLNSKNDIS